MSRSGTITRKPTPSGRALPDPESLAEMTGSSGAGEPPVTRVAIPAGQGVLVGDHNTQRNKYNIEKYIENLIQPPPALVPGHVVAGDVPQPPPGSSRARICWRRWTRRRAGGVGGACGDRDARGRQDPAGRGVCAGPASMRAGGWWRGSTPRTSAAVLAGLADVAAGLGLVRGSGDAGGGGPGGAALAGDRRGPLPAGVRQRRRPGGAAAVPPCGRGGPGDRHEQPAVDGGAGRGRAGGRVHRAGGAGVPGRADRLGRRGGRPAAGRRAGRVCRWRWRRPRR